jgi:oligopeptide/dipeptide ABC transporter ATP-binding protein
VTAIGGTEPLLVVDNLTTTFNTPEGSLRAVDGVSLELRQGEMLGVVGESGSGKSVLCRSIMGLQAGGSATHLGGSVRFDGQELVGQPLSKVRSRWGTDISMVFQDPMTSLNPVVTVGRQITEVLRKRVGMGRKAADARALELLASVGIPDPRSRVNEYPHRMSGGMRQRVVIAIAIAGEPRLLLADEPTTALDVTVSAQILDLLQAMQTEHGMAMILVSHDLSVVNGRTDHTAVMYGGQIVETAPTEKLFTSMRMPYTAALMESIPRFDDPRDARLNVIPGRPPNLLAPPVGCRFAPRCGYADEQCLEEMPGLTSAGDGHLFRCWHPLQQGVTMDRASESIDLTNAATTSGGA